MKVVCAIDFSEDSIKALNTIRAYRELFNEIVLVRVINLTRFYGLHGISMDEFIENERKISEEKLKKILKENETYRIEVGDPAEKIIEAAVSEKADLIVMGSRGRNIIKLVLFGSVAESVVKKSPISVLIVKNENVLDRILYVHYPLEIDDSAIEFLKTLSKYSKEIGIMHVIEPMYPVESTRETMNKKVLVAESTINKVEKKLDDRNVKKILKIGYPLREILREIHKGGYSLVFLRAYRKDISKTSDAILRHSKSSVLVFKKKQ